MFQTVICTVDVVLLTLKEHKLHVALFKRDKEPFAGSYALPGGYIHADEDNTAFDAALRVLKAKTGVTSPYLEQLATFSGAERDPRGWSVSIVYYALMPLEVLEAADQAGMQVLPVSAVKDLPFDHNDIVATAVKRVRSKSIYSSLPAHLCGPQFTLPELQSVYEAVLGKTLNKVSFRRKVDELDLVEEIPGAKTEVISQRPAQIYRLKRKFRHKLSTVERALLS
ncbi:MULTISPECIES: NUDIX domain-containing protein [unclassified Variovorax]|uniref:NUDIX hydrolase n=1 Tax=unclassified Variovorax TaxID=663243 RepID=UPI00076D12D3|nr:MULTISPECIES: NUDIX domain-containing protein [unclassified Variovorax]KWT98493.1 NUDIX hydrolase [Variovorax sp. WDL1]PNG49831.1 hypothetical protein CHC06_05412 [Variovorax sp. B2]PNG50703.1 hypothetical protein CHC07_05317 [Variovorax sp. B4]VTV17896.1 hypothetical protein WDL1P1_00750 [Variovorax sp. WDL1]